MPPQRITLRTLHKTRLARYFVVGGIAAIVDISTFWLLAEHFAWPAWIANTVSFMLGTLVNYLLSIRFVFSYGSKHKRWQEILLVFLVSALGLLVNQIALYLIYKLLVSLSITTQTLLLSKIAATGIVFFWNYLSRKYFIFNRHETPTSI